MGALPCPSRLASRPTTPSCSTSTAASGWATSPRPDAVEAVGALRAAGRAARLRDQRRAPRRGGLRAQAVAAWASRPSREEVVTVGRRPAARARRVRGARTAFVIGSAADPPPRHRRRAADPQRLRPRRPRRRRRRRRPRAASTTPSCAARSRPCCAAPSCWCTSRDATFPMPDGPWPATGAVVAAVEYATGAHGALGRQARAPALPHRPGPPRRRPRAGGRRSPRRRRRGRARGRARRRARAHRREHARDEAARRRPRARLRRRHAGRRCVLARVRNAAPTTSTPPTRATGACSTASPPTRPCTAWPPAG